MAKGEQEIRWTNEADMIPLRGELNRLARETHRILKQMGEKLEAVGRTEHEIEVRIREEFVQAAKLAIRYSDD